MYERTLSVLKQRSDWFSTSKGCEF